MTRMSASVATQARILHMLLSIWTILGTRLILATASLPLRLAYTDWAPERLYTYNIAKHSFIPTVNFKGNTYLRQSALMSDNTAKNQEEGPFPVYMKAYDLSRGLAAQISPNLLGFQMEGLWHTSIAIFGNEYLFGSGISYYPEARCEQITALPVARRIYLGETYVTPEIFHTYIDSLKDTFSPESYSLLRWNCNHFSNTVAEFLTGKGIPDEYVHMVERIESTPKGKILLELIQQLSPGNSSIIPVPSGKE
ncbi:desumoylating isopeptidase 1-like [Babesia ovis]|uniref:Desumoylating isopeptidase 1-like n=1 Tax=Babesia ovis TaxID=5869 RepID=A0A9W5TAL1_BABOV|nr:desumoylating isopeptidase 1-like [Babesia ovis]